MNDFLQDEAFVIAPIQPWRERDALVRFMTCQNGCLTVTVFGLLGQSNRRAGVVQPFQRLAVVCSAYRNTGRYTLHEVEQLHGVSLGEPMKLACGSYVNELAAIANEGIEDSETFFQQLQATYTALGLAASTQECARALRCFEAQLLAAHGYDLYSEGALEHRPGFWDYDITLGWVSGQSIYYEDYVQMIALLHGNSTRTEDSAYLVRIKHLHQNIIKQWLGDAMRFKSRILLKG